LRLSNSPVRPGRAGMVLSDLRQGRVFYRLNPDAPSLGRMVIGALDGRAQV